MAADAADANNQSFARFLATSSLMVLLLKNLNSRAMRQLQQQITQEIQSRKNQLQASLDALMTDQQRMQDELAHKKIKELQTRFLRLDDQVQEEMKKDLIGRVAKDHGLILHLND